jgi:hypothetical protein
MSNQLYKAEYKPEWKEIDSTFRYKGVKLLFKTDHGPAVIGVWYEGCEWQWYCSLPMHSEADKKKIRERTQTVKASSQIDWVEEGC